MSRIALVLASLLLVGGVACGGGDSGDCQYNGSPPGGAWLSQSHPIGAAFSGTAAHPPAQGQYDQGVGGGGGKFVINKVTLPQQRSDYAIDLNGDGRVDNQWGNIVGALQAQNLGPQADEDRAVADGTWPELLRLDSQDSSFQSDACALTTVQKAQSSTPAFNGTDHFTIDDTQSSATLFGPEKGGKFSSAPPATTQRPVTMTVGLSFFGGPLKLTLNGAHIQYSYAAGRLINGQINGAVKSEDVNNTVVPAIAASLTQRVQSDLQSNPPNTADANQILQIFDVGNGDSNRDPCTDPRYPNSDAAKDGKIGSCEVANNSIIKNVLAPDVQMFDAQGKYAPNKDNTNKDSLSIGFGFTAVPADFPDS